MISLDDFNIISLEDKPIFEKHYQRFPPIHSGELFTTMVSWGAYIEYRFLFIENSIVIYSRLNDNIVLHPPSGKINIDLLKKIFKLVNKENIVLGFIKKQEKKTFKNYYPSFTFIEDRDYFDYVYRASDLADLAGTKYRKIRNRLNKFTKNFVYDIETISEKNMDEINEFLKRWCLWKDCESDELLENERKAIVFSMSHFFDLHLSGIALRIDGSIQAIAVYEKMNADTIVVHFEKGAPEFDGIYKAINKETAQCVKNIVSFIDREEDLGIPGLRKAKLSYQPHHFIEIYHVSNKDFHNTMI